MEMTPVFLVTQIVTVLCAVLASSGLWSFLDKKDSKKQDRSEQRELGNKLLVGMAHDRMMFLGAKYLERGYITQDEYENFHDFLYEPYHKMGMNGSGTHMMERVDRLPIYSIEQVISLDKEKENGND